MFDLAWSEIALIAVVALVVIGPKDLPDAIRGVAKGIQKLRRMAGEFQTHVDEMVREAKLDEVRDQINQIRNFDLKGEIEKAVDADGTIRKTFEEDPFRTAPTYGPPAPETLAGGAGNDSLTAASGQAPGSIADTFGPPPAAAPAEPAPPPGPPAFIPPDVVRAAEAAKPGTPSPEITTGPSPLAAPEPATAESAPRPHAPAPQAAATEPAAASAHPHTRTV